MVNYTLTRSNRKTLALCVRDGAVEVRAPLKMPKRDIDKFVETKEKWITEKLAASKDQAEKRENFSLTCGDTVLYRGKRHPVVARSGDRVGYDDHTGEFYLPPNLSPERVKAAVIQVYEMLAKRYLAERLRHYQPIMGVSVTNFGISSAKKRWGSMSGRKSVNFSWRLIMAEDDIIGHLEKPVISLSGGEVTSRFPRNTLGLCQKALKCPELSPFSSPTGENAHAATKLTPSVALA